ncbi:MAG: helix-turn-helix domain-containing protein [Chloroflexi bacterium]|nr:helix-turn-helix domain-containing protein [Chloroflexota bacterium]
MSLFQTGKYSVAELAKEFGVSRKTAYKWLGRFAEAGVSGLEEHSRAPHQHPNVTPLPVVQAVLQAKADHPSWGPAKLLPPAGGGQQLGCCLARRQYPWEHPGPCGAGEAPSPHASLPATWMQKCEASVVGRQMFSNGGKAMALALFSLRGDG